MRGVGGSGGAVYGAGPMHLNFWDERLRVTVSLVFPSAWAEDVDFKHNFPCTMLRSTCCFPFLRDSPKDLSVNCVACVSNAWIPESSPQGEKG